MTTRVLISGAGIAGSVLAYWLSQHGFTPTVVEKAPDIRRTGGHAVDLAGVSIEIIERMGLLPAVQEARVQRDTVEFRQRKGQPLRMPRLSESISDRHVEIQRDDLVELLHRAAEPHAEHLFGDAVTALTEEDDGVKVEFENAAPRVFDLVVGADGLHSRVRRLVFGPESQFRHDLGAYLAVYSYPNDAGLDGMVLGYVDVDTAAFTYPVEDGDRARALLLFRSDVKPQRDRSPTAQLTLESFADVQQFLPFSLSHMEGAEDLYLDSISQIRMDTWSQGRMTLVGDAAYSPGPAVGGGTAMAVLGAYVLANELSLAGGDHRTAFAHVDRVMRGPIEQSRKVGPSALRQLVPPHRFAAWSTPRLMKLLTRLPRSVALAAFSLQGSDKHTLDDFSSTHLT